MKKIIIVLIILLFLLGCSPQTTQNNEISSGCGVSAQEQNPDCYIDEGGLRHCTIEPNYL